MITNRFKLLVLVGGVVLLAVGCVGNPPRVWALSQCGCECTSPWNQPDVQFCHAEVCDSCTPPRGYCTWVDGCGAGGGGPEPYTALGGSLKVLYVRNPKNLTTWPITQTTINSLLASGKAEWAVNGTEDPNLCSYGPGKTVDATQACKTVDDTYGRIFEACDNSLSCASNSHGTFAFTKQEQANFYPTWAHNATYLQIPAASQYRQFGVQIEPGNRPAKIWQAAVPSPNAGCNGGDAEAGDLRCKQQYPDYLWADCRVYSLHHGDGNCAVSRYGTDFYFVDFKPEQTGVLTMDFPTFVTNDANGAVDNFVPGGEGHLRLEQTFHFRVDADGTYRFSKPKKLKANTAVMTVKGPGGASPQGLLLNGGFGDGIDSELKYWQFGPVHRDWYGSDANPTSYHYVAAGGQSGPRFMRVYQPCPSCYSVLGPTDYSFFQDVSRASAPGDSYTWSIWIKSPSSQPISGSLVLWNLRPGGSEQVINQPFTVSSATWQQVSGSGTVQQSGGSTLRAQVYLNTAWRDYDFDTAQLTWTNPSWDGFADHAYQTSPEGEYPYTATVTCTAQNYVENCGGEGGDCSYGTSVCGYALPVTPPHTEEKAAASSVVQYAVISDKNPPQDEPVTGKVWERQDTVCSTSGATTSSAGVTVNCTYNGQTRAAQLSGGTYTCVDPTDGDTKFPAGDQVSVALNQGTIPFGWDFGCQIGSSTVTIPEDSTPGVGPDFILTRAHDAWFQTQGGDVHADVSGASDVTPTIRSQIPSTCTGSCKPYFMLPDTSGQIGVLSQASGTQDFSDGSQVPPTSSTWKAKSGTYDGLRADYEFWRRYLSDHLQDWDGIGKPANEFSLASADDVTIGSDWKVGEAGSEKRVVLVPGNVQVNANQTVTEGSSLMIVAGGTITFGSSVTSAQGVYIANTITTSTGSNAFTGSGTFIGWNTVSLNRDLGMNNNTQSAETFIYRPDIIFNLPTQVKRPLYTWREKVNP